MSKNPEPKSMYVKVEAPYLPWRKWHAVIPYNQEVIERRMSHDEQVRMALELALEAVRKK
jgi:hypothetical protein